MLLAGYPSGVQVISDHLSLVGALHPLRSLRTQQGLCSGVTPGGDHIAGLVWFETSGLGDKRRLVGIAPWIPTVESTLALLFYMFVDSMGPGDLIGILVTWTQLSTQLQRRFTPAGRGIADRRANTQSKASTARSSSHVLHGGGPLTPKALALTIIQAYYPKQVANEGPISFGQLLTLFQRFPDAMAAFLQIRTAISGAGTTFVASIYIHPAHTDFTALPAAFIVGTTRGTGLNVILAPARPPPNTCTGRLAARLPETGGLAGWLEAGSSISDQIVSGVNQLAQRQHSLGYNILDPVACYRIFHYLAGWRRTPEAPQLASWNLPLALQVDTGATAPAGEAGLPPNFAQLLEYLGQGGLYIRAPTWTDSSYALHCSSPWEHYRHQSVAGPDIVIFLCRNGSLPALFLTNPRAGNGLWLRAISSVVNKFGIFLTGEGWRSYAVHSVNWLNLPMSGRAQHMPIQPAWVDVVNNESIPPLIAQEPRALASVLDKHDSYSTLLSALFGTGLLDGEAPDSAPQEKPPGDAEVADDENIGKGDADGAIPDPPRLL